MAVTREEIVEALKEMPALELSELVKELEEVFGVSAAAPVMVAGALALLLAMQVLQTRSLNSTLSSKASATTRSLLSRLSVTSLVLA